jgi:chorismate synthase
MGSNYGTIFKISTFGESHGVGIGVVIDGCPAGVNFDVDYIQHELSRRKPGQSRITTQRKEADEFEVLSGVFEGKRPTF